MILMMVMAVGLVTGCKSPPPKVTSRDILISGAVEQPGFHKLQVTPAPTLAGVLERAGGVYPKGRWEDAFEATLIFEGNSYGRKHLAHDQWGTSFRKLGVDMAACREVRVEKIR